MIKCSKLFVRKALNQIELLETTLLNILFCFRQDSWKPGRVIFSNFAGLLL